MEGSSGSVNAAGKQPMEQNLNDPKRMPSDIEILKGCIEYHAQYKTYPLTKTPGNLSTQKDFVKNWLSSSADPEDVVERFDLIARKYLEIILFHDGIPTPDYQEFFAYSHKIFGNAFDLLGRKILEKLLYLQGSGEDSSAINAAGEENENLQTEALNLHSNVVADYSAMNKRERSSSEKLAELGDEGAAGSDHQRKKRKIAVVRECMLTDQYIHLSISNFYKIYEKYPFEDAGDWSHFVKNWLFVNDSQRQTELENRIEEFKGKHLHS